MKIFVLLTAFLEILAGAIMLLSPTVIPDFANANAGVISLARMYGAAALGLGFFAFQVWQHLRSSVMQKAFLQTFIVFHIGVAVAAYTGYRSGALKDPSVCILHLIFALATIFFYFKKRPESA